MKKILVVGSLNIDMVVMADHTPVVGETILCDRMDLVPGGKGANQACALGRLGGEVSIIGAVGEDSYGQLEIKSLENAGVDTSQIFRRKEKQTGIAMITVNSQGDNSIVVVSGANASLTEADIEQRREAFEQCDMVVFQLEIPIPTVLYAAKLAKELGKMVILDPAPVPKEFPEELFQYIDLIKPNETELHMLAGMDPGQQNVEGAVSELRKRGAGDILVTLGKDGVYLDTPKEGIVKIPARKVKAIDTTAAGDSFTGALALMLAEGKGLKEAAIFANDVSSIVVTRKGAQSSIPSMEEVYAYYGGGKREHEDD